MKVGNWYRTRGGHTVKLKEDSNCLFYRLGGSQVVNKWGVALRYGSVDTQFDLIKEVPNPMKNVSSGALGAFLRSFSSTIVDDTSIATGINRLAEKIREAAKKMDEMRTSTRKVATFNIITEKPKNKATVIRPEPLPFGILGNGKFVTKPYTIQ